MNSYFKTGSRCNLYFYCFEWIVALAIGMFFTQLPLPASIGFAIYAAATIILLSISTRKRIVSEKTHKRIQSVAFIILDVFLAVAFNSAQVLIYAVCFSAITIFVFQDNKLSRFHMLISIIMLIIAAGFISIYTGSRQTMIEFSFGTIMLIVTNWVIVSMTSIINFQNRKSYEQERSLDDLLKVVEAKCDQAQEATRIKSKFLANMSHEIRTPINAVIGMNEMILRKSSEPEIRSYAVESKIATESLLGIINDILDISKIEAGKLTIVSAEYRLPSLIADLHSLFRFRAEGKNLSFNIIVDENLPTVLIGDDIRLKEILSNFLSNAIKYTHKGSVTLEIKSTEDNSIYFCVKDTGIGIRQEDMKKLFTAFDRLDENKNRSIQGTGLGLNITCALIKLLGSEINVKSEYGKGSEFSFVLKQEIVDPTPIGKLDLVAVREYKPYQASFEAKNAKLLVVDDNEMNRRVFTNLLKDIKADIDEAASGKACLEKVTQNTYDIIFMDHMMPEMDGIETLEALRSLDNNLSKKAPVIALTANAIVGAENFYIEAGFDGFLSKPIDSDKLEKMIFTLLDSNKIDEISDTPSEKEQEISFPIIEGIDWNYAKTNTKNDKILLDTAKMLRASIKSDAMELNSYYENISEENGINSYRIKVHSMKSSAAIVGIVMLAGMAMELEAAAKAHSIATIQALHPIFIERWLSYYSLLSVITADGDAPKKDASAHSEEISQIYTSIHNAALDMDVDSLDELAEKLDEYRFDDDEAQKVAQIKSMILNFEIEKLIQLNF